MTSPAAGAPTPLGPLTTEELAQLESTLLPALERHHLRLLAHGLRSLQAIAGCRSGPLPETGMIAAWVCRQPAISTDAAFQEVFTAQLGRLGEELTLLAAQRNCEPLALELGDLCTYALNQANQRLSL